MFQTLFFNIDPRCQTSCEWKSLLLNSKLLKTLWYLKTETTDPVFDNIKSTDVVTVGCDATESSEIHAFV